MQRRTRTRHLIELAGLVQKAGLVDFADDDRATIYGALLELVGKARSEDAGDTLALWKRRGRRAFDMEAEGTPTMPEPSQEERSRRQQAVDSTRNNIELSGGELTPEADALNRRYVAGELSDTEHVDALLAHGRSLPADEPGQAYFTSFEEAMKADRNR